MGSRSVTRPTGRCSTMSHCASSRARPWRSSVRPAAASRPSPVPTRFRDPDLGTVRIDGHDLREITIDSLRSQLGVVPQEPFLFAGSCATTSPSLARTPTTPNPGGARRGRIGDLVERLGELRRTRPRAGRRSPPASVSFSPCTSVCRPTACADSRRGHQQPRASTPRPRSSALDVVPKAARP